MAEHCQFRGIAIHDDGVSQKGYGLLDGRLAYNIGYLGDPRTYGMTLRVAFGGG